MGMTDDEFDARFDLLPLDEIWERLSKRFDAGVLIAQLDLDKAREDIRFRTKGGVVCLGLLDWAHMRLRFVEERRWCMDEEVEIPDDEEEDY